MMNEMEKKTGTGNVILTARNLKKTYGKDQSLVKALDDVSLEIREGELLVILGYSAAGKAPC